MQQPDFSSSRPLPPEAQPTNARERLIVALDVAGSNEALALVDRLGNCCQWFKIGLELYLCSGSAVVDSLLSRGYSVFLDLKLHDIPNTVAGALRSLSVRGAGLITVHASGGAAMLQAAAAEVGRSAPSSHCQARAGGPAIPPELLAVTLLTSMDQQQLGEVGVSGTAADQVLRLARLAHENGIHGVVCSAHEVAAVRAALGPEAILVVPGIRPAGADEGDQRRTAEPAEAIRNGASYLVVGRPITQAADPLAAAEGILAEIDSALSSAR